MLIDLLQLELSDGRHLTVLGLGLAVLCFAARYLYLWGQKHDTLQHMDVRKEKPSIDKHAYPTEFRQLFPDRPRNHLSEEEKRQRSYDRELYNKLQRLEENPGIRGEARERLLQLLDASVAACADEPDAAFLSVKEYSPEALKSLLDASFTATKAAHVRYLERRRKGSPRELFPDFDYALDWSRLESPWSYIDGNWLGNALNSVSRDAGSKEMLPQQRIHSKARAAAIKCWSIMSEEHGDGDIAKNHAVIYQEFMSSLEKQGNRDHKLENWGMAGLGFGQDGDLHASWQSAVAQQCLGLLGDEFFPELLGHTAAFEDSPYFLWPGSHELRELDLDDTYFALHMVIDNPDTGHVALAQTAIREYIQDVQENEGDEAAALVWKRIQAGACFTRYTMTPTWSIQEYVQDSPNGEWRPARPEKPKPTPIPLGGERLRSQLVDLLVRKSGAAHDMHCGSRRRFGGHTIDDWLDPQTMTREKADNFLTAMTASPTWINQGDPDHSGWVKEISWGGRMFGGFTESEVILVREWIASLSASSPSDVAGAYARFCGSVPPQVVSVKRDINLAISHFTGSSTGRDLNAFNPVAPPAITATTKILLSAALSVWELAPLMPHQYNTLLGACILRIQRAQHGLPSVHLRSQSVVGTDPVDRPGLLELLHDLRVQDDRKSNTRTAAVSLADDLLALREAPYRSQAYLLGATWALTKVWPLLGPAGTGIAGEIQSAVLDACKLQGRDAVTWWEQFGNSFERASRVLV